MVRSRYEYEHFILAGEKKQAYTHRLMAHHSKPCSWWKQPKFYTRWLYDMGCSEVVLRDKSPEVNIMQGAHTYILIYLHQDPDSDS